MVDCLCLAFGSLVFVMQLTHVWMTLHFEYAWVVAPSLLSSWGRRTVMSAGTARKVELAVTHRFALSVRLQLR